MVKGDKVRLSGSRQTGTVQAVEVCKNPLGEVIGTYVTVVWDKPQRVGPGLATGLRAPESYFEAVK